MALAYRGGSFVSAGNAAGPDLTLTKPTGTADGDIVVIVCYFEPDTCAISISPGTWESLEVANTGAFKIKGFWKYASSEPASYTLSNDVAGDQWRSAAGAAYSGGTGAGTIQDVSSTAQADGATDPSQTAPSVTTTGADRMLTFLYGNFAGLATSATVGAASNWRGQLGGTTIGDGLIAAAGATGTTRENGAGTADYAAMHVALISNTAAAPPVGISAASPTWGFPHPPFRVT